MRTKKPWVRLRRRLFGWNVRFMIYLVSIQLGTTDRQTNQTNSLTRVPPTGQPDRSSGLSDE